ARARVSADFTRVLDAALRAFVHVSFRTSRREVLDYAVVLMVELEGQMRTVRLYDGAHDRNELHRYSRDGQKQPAENFHRGTLAEGMRAAIQEIDTGYEEMIESWQKR